MTFPNPSYWLCTTPRSGSSALSDALAHTGVAGHPTEYFNRRFWPDLFKRFEVETASDFLEAVTRRTATPNGVFGVKVMLDKDMTPTFDALRERLSAPQLTDAEVVRRAFPDLKLIYLTRRDKVAQAVSFCRAQQSGVWERYRGDEAQPEDEARFDFAALHAQVHELTLRETRWQGFFNAFSAVPYTVVYEDYVREPEEAVRGILNFLGLEPPVGWSLPQLGMEKLADATTEAWRERYWAEQPQDF